MADHLLSINNLNAYYGKARILQDVSFEVKANERVAILGRNGMGKTTLIKSIVGMSEVRREGEVLFRGENLIKKSAYDITKEKISYVPQGWLLFPSLSVEEHLIMAYRPVKGESEWTPERVFDTFPEISKRKKISGTRLSGGEQQILAIGRALVRNSELILMDEPSEGISTMVIDRIIGICEELTNQGASILVVEQNLDLALRLAKKIYILMNGQINVEVDAKEFAQDKESQRYYLGI